jgi:hypothetical protein
MIKRREHGEAKNIRIYQDTKEEFEKIGQYGESADDIMRRLIHHFKIHQSRISKILAEDPGDEKNDDMR